MTSVDPGVLNIWPPQIMHVGITQAYTQAQSSQVVLLPKSEIFAREAFNCDTAGFTSLGVGTGRGSLAKRCFPLF